jgi:hypothetical protein
LDLAGGAKRFTIECSVAAAARAPSHAADAAVDTLADDDAVVVGDINREVIRYLSSQIQYLK